MGKITKYDGPTIAGELGPEIDHSGHTAHEPGAVGAGLQTQAQQRDPDAFAARTLAVDDEVQEGADVPAGSREAAEPLSIGAANGTTFREMSADNPRPDGSDEKDDDEDEKEGESSSDGNSSSASLKKDEPKQRPNVSQSQSRAPGVASHSAKGRK